jgi:hypothetical protein
MWNKRIIVAAIGEKGVRYGNGRQMPKIFVGLVDACRADFYDVSSGGCILGYTASKRSFKLMRSFISYAEALREILSGIGIGISECRVPVRYRLVRRPYFRLKPRFEICRDTEEQVLARVQGSQTYRDDFERLQIGPTSRLQPRPGLPLC